MRYALYYTPREDSRLAAFGRAWFGNPCVAALTAQARTYGFHATLKAPFRLSDERSAGQLTNALADFCGKQPTVDAGRLVLTSLDGFLALVPENRRAALDELAADCVTSFDEFRAPPGEGELARRRTNGLTERQDHNLRTWGYPYVLEDFRFHMTLSRRLTGDEEARARNDLMPLLEPALAEPVTIDAISLSAQPAAEVPFEVQKRIALGG